MEGEEKGTVCVTGGTGFVASWLIMRLLEHGYSVNTTIRDSKKYISYITNLPGASERLKIFNADLDKPDSFTAPIEGCIGVFHVAHIIDFEETEPEETKTKRAINDKDQIKLLSKTDMVHIDDVASAHHFLLEYPKAEGRYICSAVSITLDEMSEFLSARYPEYHIPAADFLTNLPGAAERLKIFNADLGRPDSFDAALEGCTGVFHVAHVIDFEDKEPEEVQTKRAISGTLGILRACLNSKTMKRVVYTSSASTVAFNGWVLDNVDESSWTDVEFVRSLKPFAASYIISKTLTEQAALEFAEKHGLDLVTVIPTFINGPFICPRVPGSVRISLAMIFGDQDQNKHMSRVDMVHVHDVASAHIFLLEYPNAKGRYICSAVGITIDKMSEFLSVRYPEYHITTADTLKEFESQKYSTLSSKKLLDTGFKYKYGLEEMYDGAIQCCKEKGFL
ncbi:hypothetical protein RJ639_045562 [Escallonia herrerae]|uniref:Dihydroflavonol 4-reductase n=1 Tax=Escallonia herrerae TaxID=1293975 RepID=A0AA88W8B9_9ASTE|nr:hypothetical protein RJ639_045562 [Escallonia herrerae]